MNLGKCWRCEKTVYGQEGFKFGPPGKESATHKGCFKCCTTGCDWQLSLGTYKAYEAKPYCKNHYPVTGFGKEQHVTPSQGANMTTKTQMAAQAMKSEPAQSNVISPRGL